jgi:ABC-type multidrug transport system ATPase subunit
MEIELQGIGKKFYGRWLFRNLNKQLKTGDRIALVGSNGSGKSTLLRIIAGQMQASEGKLSYSLEGKKIDPELFFRQISWSGPYVELYQDLSFAEHLRLHFRFRKCLLESKDEVIELLQLGPHRDKKLRFYSSGMLQRAKVGLALFTQSEVLMLDEPTSNMDRDNARRILGLLESHLGDRIFILASNMEREFGSFSNILRLS